MENMIIFKDEVINLNLISRVSRKDRTILFYFISVNNSGNLKTLEVEFENTDKAKRAFNTILKACKNIIDLES